MGSFRLELKFDLKRDESVDNEPLANFAPRASSDRGGTCRSGEAISGEVAGAKMTPEKSLFCQPGSGPSDRFPPRGLQYSVSEVRPEACALHQFTTRACAAATSLSGQIAERIARPGGSVADG